MPLFLYNIIIIKTSDFDKLSCLNYLRASKEKIRFECFFIQAGQHEPDINYVKKMSCNFKAL